MQRSLSHTLETRKDVVSSFSDRIKISTLLQTIMGNNLEISGWESGYDIIGLGTSTPLTTTTFFFVLHFFQCLWAAIHFSNFTREGYFCAIFRRRFLLHTGLEAWWVWSAIDWKWSFLWFWHFIYNPTRVVKRKTTD